MSSVTTLQQIANARSSQNSAMQVTGSSTHEAFAALSLCFQEGSMRNRQRIAELQNSFRQMQTTNDQFVETGTKMLEGALQDFQAIKTLFQAQREDIEAYSTHIANERVRIDQKFEELAERAEKKRQELEENLRAEIQRRAIPLHAQSVAGALMGVPFS
jgi:hypothetical protein